MTERRPPQTEIAVDDLRQQLRALGYLDAGVDRFVLGPASRRRPPSAIAAFAALRIGALAAVLLGPAAALGIGTRLPGLITGSRDAVIVALYLALLFGTGAAVASFVAAILVARLPASGFATRARLLSRAAGTVVGAACLVYLTLWWRIAGTEHGPSLAWSAAALVIAVAISLLLGHATAITTFAVIVATRGEAAPEQASRARTRWLTVAAALVALVGGAALLSVSSPADPNEKPAPALAVVSPGLRVRLVAIDGFDPATFEGLRTAGRVPALGRIFGRGAIEIQPDDIRDPARAWTTIATGQPPEVHGIAGLETRRLAGVQGSVTSTSSSGLGRAIRGATDLLRLTRPAIASGTQLRSKALWEVAADAGLRPAVVNWWATWPAADGGRNPPVVLSDRAVLRLDRGGELDGEVAPRALYDRLRTAWPDVKAQASALMSLLPPATDAESNAALRRAAEVDALQVALASRLDGAALDLIAIYLPGLDIAQQALLGSGASTAPSAVAARLEAIRSYYGYLDVLLKDWLTVGEDGVVMVLTEPGRVQTTATATLAAAGGGIAASLSGRGRAIDVAPTVLHVLGVPVSRELAGAPLLGVFSPELLAKYPVRQVESYGRRLAKGPRSGQPLDQEMIERLRSLGYVR